MNSIEALKINIIRWLDLHPDSTETICELFDIANRQEQWRVKMFYVRFAPYMAKVLDEELESKK